MLTNSTAEKKPRKSTLHLVGLVFFLVALLVNLTGVKYGFPLLTHNDEPSILQHVINMTKWQLCNTNYHKPHQTSTHFYSYLNIVSHIAYGQNIAKINDKTQHSCIYMRASICVSLALLYPSLHGILQPYRRANSWFLLLSCVFFIHLTH